MELMRRIFAVPSKMTMLAVLASIFFSLVSASTLAQTTAQTTDLDLGIKLLNEQKFDEAIKLLQKVTTLNKNDAEGWYYLGAAYIHLGDFKKATKSLETAISLRAQFLEAHTALSYALLRRGRLAEARVLAKRALAIEPTNADAHYTLGVIEFRSRSNEQAVEHANQAIKQKPGFAEAYLLKGQALVSFFGTILERVEIVDVPNRARYREAAEALEKYVELVPDSENRRIWKDQAETLNLYARSSGGPTVYTGREVTTRARLISKPEPSYTEEARQSLITGTVILKVVFADDGLVKHVMIIQALPGGLTEQAVRSARRIRFVPATLDGKPVSMWMRLEYNFILF